MAWMIKKPDDVNEWPTWITAMDELEGHILQEYPEIFKNGRYDDSFFLGVYTCNKNWLVPVIKVFNLTSEEV